MREALNNVVKHAWAGEVKLGIACHQEMLHIQVADNGRGFSVTTATSGEGLRNMHARLKNAGGDCQIESGPSGTTVTFTLPLKTG